MKKNELQEKISSISSIASTTEIIGELNSTSSMTSDQPTDEQVKNALDDYFELKCSIGEGSLKILTRKGLLNYDESSNIEINNDNSYSAKTFSIEPDSLNPAENEMYTFTVKNNNGHCVIDSINKQ